MCRSDANAIETGSIPCLFSFLGKISGRTTLSTQNIFPSSPNLPDIPNTSSLKIVAQAGSSLRTKTDIVSVMSSSVTIFPPLLVLLASITIPTKL